MDTPTKPDSWLKRVLSDGADPSSSRVIAVPTLLAVYLIPLLVWAVLSASAGALLEVPGSLTGFIAAVSAPLLVFVNRQKKLEGDQ